MDRGIQPAQASGLAQYFRRFGFCAPQVAVPPPAGLGLVVVVPCFNEPDLTGALGALWDCARPDCLVEVIVVINAPAGSSPEIFRQNERTLREATAWAAGHGDPRLRFHFLYFPELPPKQAGVGLARKIGMDEALRRLVEAGKAEGVIAGFDADCRCEPNYLRSLERHFQEHPRTPACGIYFEHPLSGPLAPALYEGIAAYELHLRYYVQALRYAGFPYAYHTFGSGMAVRAEVYRQQGGMNRRQAGEDFYFLHKLIPLGEFSELSDTVVYPSPRSSERVPFGTGRAMRDYLGGQPLGTYPLESFLELKAFFDLAPAFYACACAEPPALLRRLPPPLRAFLRDQRFEEALGEIRANTATEPAFRKRLFRWFDGFRAVKFINYGRDQLYGERAVVPEARQLLALVSPEKFPHPSGAPGPVDARALLGIFRELDRAGWRGRPPAPREADNHTNING
jgi:hypothetical protein